MSYDVPLFAYGTLRVGEGNYQWVEDAVVAYEENATASGHIWFAHSYLTYPVARFLDSTHDRIVGDVLWMDGNHSVFGEMCAMEIRAGYEVRIITVRLTNKTEIQALGFHYCGTPQAELFIESGDWRKARQEISKRRVEGLKSW